MNCAHKEAKMKVLLILALLTFAASEEAEEGMYNFIVTIVTNNT